MNKLPAEVAASLRLDALYRFMQTAYIDRIVHVRAAKYGAEDPIFVFGMQRVRPKNLLCATYNAKGEFQFLEVWDSEQWIKIGGR